MINVIRTRLDDGAPAVVRATAEDLTIAMDDRHITPHGAEALALALNGLGGPAAQQPSTQR
ncbi:hypothetical protein ABT390_13640 [Streptomyces aurantiacus]|uniref:Uncharacterized protein n=1 Tax=Streptomyces aurantiacus JA 4570 TaxID=1286094 RepID=S3ZB47_9ACTN|nr:hypothetical protein [Streptomyces aurantiacus]EPH40358.1 hypothetical protein STRAU_6621 [Streptomyces aurantiacus JA 4570]